MSCLGARCSCPGGISLQKIYSDRVVEDHDLLVKYGSRGGGLTTESKKKHISGTVGHYLIAHHNVNEEGHSNFTCHENVTPQNFPGRTYATTTKVGRPSVSDPRTAQALMYDVPYKGQQRAFHDNVAICCIQR